MATPRLTDIRLIFSEQDMKRLDAQPEISLPSEWGPDRVVSIANRDTCIKNQFGGTCTAFAIVAAMENKLGGSFDLSERSLWHGYTKTNTFPAIEAAKTQFLLEEKFWPQDQRNPESSAIGKGRFKLSAVDFLDSDYEAVLSAIDNGNPCVVAMRTPKDLHRGHAQVEASSNVYRWAGHVMCVSGYKVENGEAYIRVKNSYGPNFGDNGYQYVSMGVFETRRRAYGDFWEVKEVFDRGEQQATPVSEELF